MVAKKKTVVRPDWKPTHETASILEKMPLAVVVMEAEGDLDDQEWRLLMVNQAMVDALHVPADQMVGQTLREAFGPVYQTDLPQWYRKAVETQEVQKVPPTEYADDNVPETVFDNTVVPIGLRRIAVCSYAITALVQAQATLRMANADLAASNQDLERFAYVASHDLKEPLRMVASYTELVRREISDDLDEKTDRHMRYVVEGIGRMQTLLRDLLSYSKVGRSGYTVTEVDTQAVVEAVLQSLAVAIENAEAQITVDELPAVLANEAHVLQIFQNLVSNALKFSTPDRPPEIGLSGRRGGDGMCEFSVTDNGIGLDLEAKDRIFEMFQRQHTRAEYPGTGIGLAIVRRAVERRGGKISVDSVVGRGTTFTFSLPEVTTPER